jgi:predicted ferric reductase
MSARTATEERRRQPRRGRRFGLHPLLLLAGYCAIALLPLGLAWAQDLPARPWRDDLSSGLALAGFAMLLMEFAISGRFRIVSARIGIDLSMRFHQLVARTLAVFVLLHPWLYTLPVGEAHGGDTTGVSTLGLAGANAASGWLAWFALLLLIVWAMFRGSFGYRYEVWRVAHGLCAIAVAVFGLHHALGAGRYSADPALAGVWYVLVAIALLSMVHVYLLRPLFRIRHPYRVAAVERIADRTWELAVEPRDGEAIAFAAGQFAWLSVNRSPWAITDHPFSISSAPGARPRVTFAIKEAGDFTATVGRIPVGAPAYLDGPHGNLVPSDRSAPGLVLIAGGVGLAPIMSILRQARIDRDPRPIRLLYGNRIEAQIMHRDELDAIGQELDLVVHHVLADPPPGWRGKTGQLDAATLGECLDMPARERWLYVICGPAPMIDAVEHSLGDLGIPLSRMLSEKFSYD